MSFTPAEPLVAGGVYALLVMPAIARTWTGHQGRNPAWRPSSAGMRRPGGGRRPAIRPRAPRGRIVANGHSRAWRPWDRPRP